MRGSGERTAVVGCQRDRGAPIDWSDLKREQSFADQISPALTQTQQIVKALDQAVHASSETVRSLELGLDLECVAQAVGQSNLGPQGLEVQEILRGLRRVFGIDRPDVGPGRTKSEVELTFGQGRGSSGPHAQPERLERGSRAQRERPVAHVRKAGSVAAIAAGSPGHSGTRPALGHRLAGLRLAGPLRVTKLRESVGELLGADRAQNTAADHASRVHQHDTGNALHPVGARDARMSIDVDPYPHELLLEFENPRIGPHRAPHSLARRAPRGDKGDHDRQPVPRRDRLVQVVQKRGCSNPRGSRGRRQDDRRRKHPGRRAKDTERPRSHAPRRRGIPRRNSVAIVSHINTRRSSPERGGTPGPTTGRHGSSRRGQPATFRRPHAAQRVSDPKPLGITALRKHDLCRFTAGCNYRGIVSEAPLFPATIRILESHTIPNKRRRPI